jgi:hypothetical protein
MRKRRNRFIKIKRRLEELVEKLEYWSSGRDLKGFPKPLRSLKNGRSGVMEDGRIELMKNCGNGVMD